MTTLPTDTEVAETWKIFQHLSQEVMKETGRPMEITANRVNWIKFFEDCLSALKSKDSRIHELEGNR